MEDAGASMNILEQCVVRHNFRCVRRLPGADVLGPTRMKDDALSSVFGGDQVRRDQVQRILQGESRLSRMARDMPSILSFVLDHLESLPAEARGRSVRSILESWQMGTAGVVWTMISSMPEATTSSAHK
jgi:hypothetical protein